MKTILSAEQQKKVIFVKKSGIQKYINPDQLWKHMGGNVSFAFVTNKKVYCVPESSSITHFIQLVLNYFRFVNQSWYKTFICCVIWTFIK